MILTIALTATAAALFTASVTKKKHRVVCVKYGYRVNGFDKSVPVPTTGECITMNTFSGDTSIYWIDCPPFMNGSFMITDPL